MLPAEASKGAQGYGWSGIERVQYADLGGGFSKETLQFLDVLDPFDPVKRMEGPGQNRRCPGIRLEEQDVVQRNPG